LANDIPPVNAKIDNSNVSPIEDILTWHYLQIKIINLIKVKHLVLLCKYSINFTSVRKLNRSRYANECSENIFLHTAYPILIESSIIFKMKSIFDPYLDQDFRFRIILWNKIMLLISLFFK
jgi:hypothetical protein